MTVALTLLGDVRWRGAPVAGERSQALPAALAAAGARPVRAERLIDLVWDDEARANARKVAQGRHSAPWSRGSATSTTCRPPARPSRRARMCWWRSSLGAVTSECLPLRDEVHASGLTLQVGTMRRFDPGISFARDFVREEIGELIALKAWYCDSAYRYQMTDTLQPLPRSSANARKPPGDPKSDRRRYYMIGHGSHLIDTARFLVGEEITSVRAELAERAGAYCWFVSVEFADGSIGHLDLTMSVQMDWHEGFHIYGEHGSVTAKSFLPWYYRASEVEGFSARDRRYHRPLGEDAHFWRRQVEGFADSVLTGAPQLGANVDDGLAAMRVMDAIEQSVETGATVAIDPTFVTA